MLLSKSKNDKMEEIRKYITLSQSANFDSIVPHIKNAESDYLIPLIGTDMYNYIHAIYQYTINHEFDGSACDEKTELLIEIIQSALVHLAFWIGYDVLNAHITDGGFKRIESDTVKGLYKYQEDNLKNYLKSCGFNQLDHLLGYLEANIEDFEDYKNSENYTQFKSMLVQTTDQFNETVFINKSRLTFLRVKAHMKIIEETEIKGLLGSAVYSYIKQEIIKDSPDQRVTDLLPMLRKPIIFLATALLMEESGADLTDKGLYFKSAKAVGVNSTEMTPSSDLRISVLVNRYRNYGKSYLDQLYSYLQDNNDTWPEVIISSGKLFRRNNTCKKTFWQ